MKKSIIFASLALATALTGFTSCGDFLDKEPSNDLSKEKTFSGWVNAQQFHYDTYNFLLHGALRVNNSFHGSMLPPTWQSVLFLLVVHVPHSILVIIMVVAVLLSSLLYGRAATVAYVSVI